MTSLAIVEISAIRLAFANRLAFTSSSLAHVQWEAETNANYLHHVAKLSGHNADHADTNPPVTLVWLCVFVSVVWIQSEMFRLLGTNPTFSS